MFGCVSRSDLLSEDRTALILLNRFDYLDADFPLIPKPYIRTCLNRTVYYAPAHVELKASLDLANPPYNKLHRPRKDKGKGTAYQDDELEVEREFVLTRAALVEAEQAAKAAAEEQEAKEEAAGHVFECGCCFGDYVFSKMVQCPEAHLFCMDCARRNAENAMGNRQTAVSCMDQDGCTVPFTDAECARFLKPNQISLLEKLRSEKALDAAGIAGLAKCPYCPWACVIDNPREFYSAVHGQVSYSDLPRQMRDSSAAKTKNVSRSLAGIVKKRIISQRPVKSTQTT